MTLYTGNIIYDDLFRWNIFSRLYAFLQKFTKLYLLRLKLSQENFKFKILIDFLAIK